MCPWLPASGQAVCPEGWLRTGDLGFLAPDGSLWLLGRAKDMVKSGGENVFAAEVEAVLASHPGVAAAAVVGLPHERLGEQVRGDGQLQLRGTHSAPLWEICWPPPPAAPRRRQHVPTPMRTTHHSFLMSDD